MAVEDTTTVETGEIETTTLPQATSVADHAAMFGPQAKDDPDAPDGETVEERAVRLHHSAEQRREKQTGKFTEGKVRHRAQSQTAGKDDVKAINEYTGRIRSVVDELGGDIARKDGESDRVFETRRRAELLERHREASKELKELKAKQASPAAIDRAERKVERTEAAVPAKAFSEPKPTEDDPKFNGDYSEFLIGVAEWAGRKAAYEDRQAEQARSEKTRKQASERELLTSWAGRVEAAKKDHADFEKVAFGPTRIPEGSAVDAFIMEHDAGPKVLYYLNSHAEELDSILRLSALGQIERLVALATSLSPSRSAAETTTAAPARKPIVLPPTPPTVVRTEALSDRDPDPTTGPRSIAEHQKRYGTRR